MKPWIETKKFWFSMEHLIDDEARGENWRLRRITPDKDGLDRWLDTLIARLNHEQWEIKSVLQLDRGRAYQEIAPTLPAPPERKPGKPASVPPAEIDNYGLGWGTAVAWSVCLLCQRTIWLSDDDYAARIAERENELSRIERQRQNELAQQRNAEINAEMAPLEMEREKLAQAAIVSKKPLIGKAMFQFNGSKFATEAEAETARSAEIAALDARIATLRDRLTPLVEDEQPPRSTADKRAGITRCNTP